MKKLILPLAIVAMVALLGAAAAWDCVRLAADARYRVSLADQEMEKHELRLVKLLSASSASAPDVQAAVATYRAAENLQTRHEAYEQLVANLRNHRTDEHDATNPLDRKFMDDVAGAINRREIAQQPYEEEFAAYQRFLSSFRGRAARWLSARARADWTSSR
jgi:hypothetical protein